MDSEIKGTEQSPEINPQKYVQLIFGQKCKGNSTEKGHSLQHTVKEPLDAQMYNTNLYHLSTSHIFYKPLLKMYRRPKRKT